MNETETYFSVLETISFLSSIGLNVEQEHWSILCKTLGEKTFKNVSYVHTILL
jgi:hypothetical protein